MQENEKNKTPALANWLASKFIKKAQLEEFLGDLEEIYTERISVRGKLYAKLIYWIDMLHLLIGFSALNPFKNNTAMYKHYLIIANRNLWRNKLYSLINIFSLAVGMGICLLICQYIHFELGYDRFHDNFKNTYRITTNEIKNSIENLDPFTGYAVGSTAKKEIPGIDEYVRVHKYLTGTVVTNPDNDRVFHEDNLDMLFVDNSFFQVFDYPLGQGAEESVFEEKFNMVITEKAVRKYFGSEDPIGKTLEVNTPPSPGTYTVTGVLEDLPANSNLQFEFILPMENFMDLGWGGAVQENSDGWEGWKFITYVTLDRSADPDDIREKLDDLYLKYKGERNALGNIEEKVVLQPIADIHLKSDSYSDPGYVPNLGNILNIKIFSIIAIFILLIAWVNYINLSTARSMQRAKEVGIRKSLGAFRRQLTGQFLVESFLVNFSSAILALGIAFLTLPVLNHIIGKELQLSILGIPMFWMYFLILNVFGSLLSGLYPAFVLSAFKPISMLGAGNKARAGNLNLRRGLIVFQLLISLLLIAGTYLVYRQVTFMKDQELGIDMEKILVLKGPEVAVDEAGLPFKIKAFREEVVGHSSISNMAGSVLIPGQVNNTSIQDIRKLGDPVSSAPYGRGVVVGLDFPKTYGLEFVAGSSFTEDMSDYGSVIINEEAVRAYGLGTPENAIKEKLIGEEGTLAVIGVVKNFHWHSLKDVQMPYMLILEASAHSYLSFSMNLSNIPQSLTHIESVYRSFFPNNPFDYFFLEDDFNRQYQTDVQFGNLFMAFAILAIFIACIGLFALISYSATLRVKEIGIRKVLGASIGNVMVLLSKEYIVLLFAAIVLAVPAIFVAGRAWLDNYAFATSMGVGVFLVPGLIIVLVSLLTVGHRTYSAAKSNPVESLKIE